LGKGATVPKPVVVSAAAALATCNAALIVTIGKTRQQRAGTAISRADSLIAWVMPKYEKIARILYNGSPSAIEVNDWHGAKKFRTWWKTSGSYF
jgi:hypothetical protein